MDIKKARVIAFYLPQYHPIPENDKWWGPGFTEWRNVVQGRPLFQGHAQPKMPADLGFYDLRLPEIREQQAQLAKDAGIEGFCYYHYWFNGKLLLERPFEEVLKSGKPDLPFCLCWANHTWSNKTWTVKKGSLPSIIIEQTYSDEDIDNHFNYLLPAFKDPRYITVDGKPIFVIYAALDIPNTKQFIERWNELAKQNGLPGIHFIGIQYSGSIRPMKDKGFFSYGDTENAKIKYKAVLDAGYDAVASDGRLHAELKVKGKYRHLLIMLAKKMGVSITNKFDQRKINKNLYVPEDKWENVYPEIVPNWDRTARSKITSIYINSTPEVFYEGIMDAIKLVEHKDEQHRILFLKSWNEWGEGNYVEPDIQYGHGYIEALAKALSS